MTETVAAPQVDRIIEKYIALRDKKAELKAAYDGQVKDLDAAMSRIENFLLAKMQELGVESLRTPFGTPYIQRRTSASVADWEAVLDWVRSNEEWGMLERRVSKTAVEAWRDEHNDLPPGLNWREERVVNIRRN